MTVVDPRRTPTAEARRPATCRCGRAPTSRCSARCSACSTPRASSTATFLAPPRRRAPRRRSPPRREWTPERAAEAMRRPGRADRRRRAARSARARRAMALWSMGANQSTVGTLKNRALINLCLATGNIGRPGTGPLSLTGQPNAMGGRESGGLAHLLPGYRKVTDRRPPRRDAAAVGRPRRRARDQPGAGHRRPPSSSRRSRTAASRSVWIVATNPVVSQPDAARFAAALRRAELVVVQDAYHPTETGALAHVVLPAAQWAEKEGTQTNSERRVSLMRRARRPARRGAARLGDLRARRPRARAQRAVRLATAAEVHAEYVAHDRRPAVRPDRAVARAAAARGRAAVAGARARPDGEDHDGHRAALRVAALPDADGRARMAPTPHAEPADAPDADYPLVLTTGRVAHQWHTMTRTGKVARPAGGRARAVRRAARRRRRARRGRRRRAGLRPLAPRARDAARARERRACPGVAFAPFHWGALHLRAGRGRAERRRRPRGRPDAAQAELKATAVRVEPVRGRAAATRRPRGARRRLVVVGAGMAGMATVEALLEHARRRRWDVTIVGAEPEPPYNRVLLSQVLAGAVGEHELGLRDARWFADARGRAARSACRRARSTPAARAVELADGERWLRRPRPRDRLAAVRPAGRRASAVAGVHVVPHAAPTRARSSRRPSGARRAVVIGGGLLGLEAARGAARARRALTVVHLADRLMEQQLDAPAASLLERALRDLGIKVRIERAHRGDRGRRPGERVVLAGGEELAADLVVVAAGIRPDVDLARTAGLEVGRGILVDDELRTSAPGVRAVGECAEHRGTVYGLWAPLLRAGAGARRLAGRAPAAFLGAAPATTLKVAGIEPVLLRPRRPPRSATRRCSRSTPAAAATAACSSARTAASPARSCSATCATPRALRELLDAPASEVPPSCSTASPSAGRGLRRPSSGGDPGVNVCSCQGVTRGEIVARDPRPRADDASRPWPSTPARRPAAAAAAPDVERCWPRARPSASACATRGRPAPGLT